MPAPSARLAKPSGPGRGRPGEARAPRDQRELGGRGRVRRVGGRVGGLAGSGGPWGQGPGRGRGLRSNADQGQLEN